MRGTPELHAAFPEGWAAKDRGGSIIAPAISGRITAPASVVAPRGYAIMYRDWSCASIGPLSTVDSIGLSVDSGGNGSAFSAGSGGGQFPITKEYPYFGRFSGDSNLITPTAWKTRDFAAFVDSVGQTYPIVDVIFWKIPPMVIPSTRAPLYRGTIPTSDTGSLILFTSGRLYVRLMFDNASSSGIQTVRLYGNTVNPLVNGAIDNANDSNWAQLPNSSTTYSVAAGGVLIREINLSEHGISSADAIKVTWSTGTAGQRPDRVILEARD